MSIFEIDPLRDSRWSAFVDGHPRSSTFHRTEWLQALQSAYGYQAAAFTTCAPNLPLSNSLVFCRIRSTFTGNRFVSLPFSDHCEILTGAPEEDGELVSTLRLKLNGDNWEYLELRPVNPLPGTEKLVAPVLNYVYHRLDLERSENELFKGFHKDCVQRKIRRAERESLRYAEGTSDQLLDQFYRLFVLTRRRHGLPPQPLRWFRSLTRSFGNKLKIRVASKDGLPVASIITLSHRKTMTFKYGSSDARFNNLGGTALLLWRAMSEARAEGYEEFDMGRTDRDNAGLIAFKDHWGARCTTLTYYRYPAGSAAPGEGPAMKVARRFMSVAPAALLRAIGSLSYRHIG
jgi:hypothetical protein